MQESKTADSWWWYHIFQTTVFILFCWGILVSSINLCPAWYEVPFLRKTSLCQPRLRIWTHWDYFTWGYMLGKIENTKDMILSQFKKLRDEMPRQLMRTSCMSVRKKMTSYCEGKILTKLIQIKCFDVVKPKTKFCWITLNGCEMRRLESGQLIPPTLYYIINGWKAIKIYISFCIT
jgi:hypothetical protein